MKKIVFFTGSGISVASGLPTYRAEDGVWDNHNISEIATHQATLTNLLAVNKFFNQARQKVFNGEPNEAHYIISQLQSKHHVNVITQNIDHYHEWAGSEIVHHLHGNIFETTTTGNPKRVVDIRTSNIEEDERDPKTNGRLRPNVVMFGEEPQCMQESISLLKNADIVVVVGTSLQVSPANNLIYCNAANKEVYIIDPDDNYLDKHQGMLDHAKHIKKDAIDGLKEFLEIV